MRCFIFKHAASMNYTLNLDPKIIALAAAGAATLGLTLDAALLRPVVKPATTPTDSQDTENPAAGDTKKGGEA